MQAAGYTYLFSKGSGALGGSGGNGALINVSVRNVVLIIVTLTAGATLLMWVGELITQRGIGNGMSLLIFASILTSAPAGISAWWNGSSFEKLSLPLVVLGVIFSVVYVQEGIRKIPIQYAKRMVGRRMTSGGSTYLPLRVNMAGVIPVIFASAVMLFPVTVAQLIPSGRHPRLRRVLQLPVLGRSSSARACSSSPSRSSTWRSCSTRSSRRTTSRSTAASSPASDRGGPRRCTWRRCWCG